MHLNRPKVGPVVVLLMLATAAWGRGEVPEIEGVDAHFEGQILSASNQIDGLREFTLDLDANAIDSVQGWLSLVNQGSDYDELLQTDGTVLFRACVGPVDTELTFDLSFDGVVDYASGMVATLDWGDGTAPLDNPAQGEVSHTFAPGSYTMVLTVVNPNPDVGGDCVGTSTYDVFVGDYPNFSWTAYGDELCLPQAAHVMVIQGDGSLVDYQISYSDDSEVVSFSTAGDTTVIHTFEQSSCGAVIEEEFFYVENAFQGTLTASNACSSFGIPMVGTVLPIRVSQGPELAIETVVESAVCPDSVIAVSDVSTVGEIATTEGCSNEYVRYWELDSGLILLSGDLGSPNGATGVSFDPTLWDSGDEHIEVTASAIGVYEVTMWAGTQCGEESTSTFIEVNTTSVFESGDTDCEGNVTDVISLCLGQTAPLYAEFFGPGPLGVVTTENFAGDCYLSSETLTFPGGASPSMIIYESTFVAESPGLSTLLIEATDGDGVVSSQVIVIDVLDIERPTIELTTETGEFGICEDSELGVTATSVGGQESVSTWSWNLNDEDWSENEATIFSEGTYEVTGETISGCIVEAFFDVVLTPPTSLSLEGASQALCFGDSAFVEVIPSPDDDFSSYQWASDWNGGGGQVLDTLGAGAWLTAGSYQVTALSDGVGCGGIETFVLSESTPPPSTYSDVNICWGDVEEVSFEFDGGSASPAEGYFSLYLYSTLNGWDGSFLSIDVIHEDGTVTNSIVTMPNGSTFANFNNVPELAIVYGDSVEVTYVSNNPDNDQYFSIDIFNCVTNCISEPDNCYSFNDLTSGLLFSGQAGCGPSIQGVWSEPSNLGNNVFSETSQFNTTWSAYQPGNYELCFEDFQCGVTNCFNVSITEPEAGFDCDGNSLCGTPSVSTLTVEITENVLDDLDLYRLYVDLPPNSNWYVSAVAGDQNISSLNPLRVTTMLSAPDGVFNTPLNSSWNASGLGSAFVAIFPELAFDSYATIGLSGPASESLLANAIDPGFSGSSQTTTSFLNFFNTSGEGELVMEDGVWFITPTNANQGVGDENGRCLIGQLCSSGSIDGQIVVQILESSLLGGTITDGGEMARFSFNGSGTFEGVSVNTFYLYGGGIEALKNVPICGCDDPYASNYIPWVELGVDTCEYDCTDEDEDGICDEVDDCVGEYDSCGVCNGPGAVLACGCTDVPEGDCDCEGSQLDVLGVCGGGCLSDQNGNGICDDTEVFGCTYELGENYSLEATIDDGSCIFPCEGEVNINVFDWDGDYAVTVTDFLMMLSVYGDVDVDLDGIWDSGDLCVDTNACNYATDPSEPCSSLDVLGICGGGCEADEDADGICDDVDTCVGIEDECGVCNGPGPTEIVIEDITVLYDSVYLPQLGEWYVYEFGADTTFSYTCAPSFSVCGDPVNYQGYAYATVLIGEQCWFAENLRSENYENGEVIPTGLSYNEWLNTASGAVAVYGEDYGCADFSPDINACDPVQSLSEYGRLYNWYAVNDARGICPSSWHVPTDGEWTVITEFLGGENLAGVQMKATYGWYPGGNGTNSSGFGGLPGGSRIVDENYYHAAGLYGLWWSSSEMDEFSAIARWLGDIESYIGHAPKVFHDGLSIRCLKDLE